MSRVQPLLNKTGIHTLILWASHCWKANATRDLERWKLFFSWKFSLTCVSFVCSPFFLITTTDQVCAYDFSTTALLAKTVMEWSTTADLVPWCRIRHSVAASVTNSNWNSVLFFVRAAYFTCQFKNTKIFLHVQFLKSLRGSQLIATSFSLDSHTSSLVYNTIQRKHGIT